jgi:hypothetical protein
MIKLKRLLVPLANFQFGQIKRGTSDKIPLFRLFYLKLWLETAVVIVVAPVGPAAIVPPATVIPISPSPVIITAIIPQLFAVFTTGVAYVVPVFAASTTTAISVPAVLAIFTTGISDIASVFLSGFPSVSSRLGIDGIRADE